jgi:hypothetical protein
MSKKKIFDMGRETSKAAAQPLEEFYPQWLQEAHRVAAWETHSLPATAGPAPDPGRLIGAVELDRHSPDHVVVTVEEHLCRSKEETSDEFNRRVDQRTSEIRRDAGESISEPVSEITEELVGRVLDALVEREGKLDGAEPLCGTGCLHLYRRQAIGSDGRLTREFCCNAQEDRTVILGTPCLPGVQKQRDQFRASFLLRSGLEKENLPSDVLQLKCQLKTAKQELETWKSRYEQLHGERMGSEDGGLGGESDGPE